MPPSSDLNRTPTYGGRPPRVAAAAIAAPAARACGVLLVVGTVAVPVLEVDPQILDRLRLELAGQGRPHARHVVWVQPRRGGERRCRRGVSRQCGGGCPAPLRGQPRMHPVGRHVDGVDRLPGHQVAGVFRDPFRVGRGEESVDRGEVGVGQRGRRDRQARRDHGHVPVMCSGRTGSRARASPVAWRIADATAGPDEIVGASPAPRRP